jgi:hypothetical protein
MRILNRSCTSCVRYEVFTAVTMKSSILWDITPCSPAKDRESFGTTFHLNVCPLRAPINPEPIFPFLASYSLFLLFLSCCMPTIHIHDFSNSPHFSNHHIHNFSLTFPSLQESPFLGPGYLHFSCLLLVRPIYQRKPMETDWLACKFHPSLHNPVFFHMLFAVLAVYFTLVSCLAYFNFCTLQKSTNHTNSF